jgi:hypothetical protein
LVQSKISVEQAALAALNAEAAKQGATEETVVSAVEWARWRTEEEIRLSALATQRQIDDAKALKDARVKLARDTGGIMQGLLDSAASAMEDGSKKQFDVQKAASASQAGIAGVEASVQAFNSLVRIPYVGPALGAAAALTTATFAALNVKKILSAKFGGGITAATPSMPSGDSGGSSAPMPTTIVRGGREGAGPIIEINAKVVDEMALKEFSKDIYRAMTGWQDRGEVY